MEISGAQPSAGEDPHIAIDLQGQRQYEARSSILGFLGKAMAVGPRPSTVSPTEAMSRTLIELRTDGDHSDMLITVPAYQRQVERLSDLHRDNRDSPHSALLSVSAFLAMARETMPAASAELPQEALSITRAELEVED